MFREADSRSVSQEIPRLYHHVRNFPPLDFMQLLVTRFYCRRERNSWQFL